MFAAAWRTTKSALFPLATMTADGATTLWGAAFFVDKQGTFLTCAHTLNPKLGSYRYIGRITEGAHFPPLEIEILDRDERTDVGVGRVLGLDVPGIMNLGDRDVADGSSVIICGYPIFVDHEGKRVPLRPRFQPTFVLDRTDTDRGRMVEMRDNPFFGMSGGPIVDANSLVVGLQSAVVRPRYNRKDDREFKVETGLAVEVSVLRDALKRVRGGASATNVA